MKNSEVGQNPSNPKFAEFRRSRTLIATFAIGVSLSLLGCGLSKPGVSDIEPYVMSELGQCPLWAVSDVRKVDGIASGDTYRVDFTAQLILKAEPEQALQAYIQHQGNPSYVSCHVFVANLANPTNGKLSKQYAVSGAGNFVKSEKGWRLTGELHDYAFVAAAMAAGGAPAIMQSADVPSAVSAGVSAAPTSGMVQPEPAPPAVAMSPCIAAKVASWERQHEKELAQDGDAARARGEELNVSAGQEALMKQEAVDKATAECR